jgi:hypothetical protein
MTGEGCMKNIVIKHDAREFQKYKTRGAYHWEQASNHLIKRNSFVLG